MTNLAAAPAMVSIADEEESMARPTERSRVFAERRAQRGSRFVAEAEELPGGGGFVGRFTAPGYELMYVETASGQREVFPDADTAEIAAARILIKLLTQRSNQLAFEKNERYRKMTPAELAEGLAAAGITAELLAHIMGTDPNRVRKWLEGLEDVPHPARIILALLGAAPSNVDVAVKATDAVATARKESR